MEKLAQAVRMAEVNGFVAGLIDMGVIKVASEEEAAVIAGVIEEHLPEEYDMQDAMAVAADVVDALDENAGGAPAEEGAPEGEDEGMVVQASDEYDEGAIMAAYGELAMAKEAGDISEEDFEKEAKTLIKMATVASSAKDLASKAWAATKGGVKSYGNAMRGKGISDLNRGAGHAKSRLKKLQEGVDYTNKKYRINTELRDTGEGVTNLAKLKEFKKARNSKIKGTTTAYAGTAAAGLGAKALYDKYKK